MPSGNDIFSGVGPIQVPSAGNAPAQLKGVLTDAGTAALGVITENLDWVILLFALALGLVVVYRLVFRTPYEAVGPTDTNGR